MQGCAIFRVAGAPVGSPRILDPPWSVEMQRRRAGRIWFQTLGVFRNPGIDLRPLVKKRHGISRRLKGNRMATIVPGGFRDRRQSNTQLLADILGIRTFEYTA